MYLFDTAFGIIFGVFAFGFMPGLIIGAWLHKYIIDDEDDYCEG